MNLANLLKKTTMWAILACSLASFSAADILVIVHPENTAEITPRFVKNLYQGKTTRFSDGTAATPIMLAEDDPLTLEFLDKIVEQRAVQFKRLWSQALFTGRGTPPEHIDSEQQLVSLVAGNRSYIGFIHRDNFTNDVKAVIRITYTAE